MNADNQFDWVAFYKELAEKLHQYKDNRAELIENVKKNYSLICLLLKKILARFMTWA